MQSSSLDSGRLSPNGENQVPRHEGLFVLQLGISVKEGDLRIDRARANSIRIKQTQLMPPSTFKSSGETVLVAPKTLSVQLADKICDRIRDHRMTPGTRLGTEADLVNEFGVSRQVVREAIGCLRGLGVVTSRQRMGLFVDSGDVSSVLRKTLSPQASDEKGWQELKQLRVVIELGSIPMAMERASDEECNRLTVIASEMRQLMKSYNQNREDIRDRLLAKDIEFHQTILAAAHGELVSGFHEVLLEYFQVDVVLNDLPSLRTVREHERIAKAFVRRDTADAVELMTKHFQPLLAKPRSL